MDQQQIKHAPQQPPYVVIDGHPVATHSETRVDPVKDSTGANLFEWFELWMPAILIIIPAWFAYKTMKEKARIANEERRMKYREENREEEFVDTTVLEWAQAELKKRKKK